ncbi:MAG: hypothetical protein Q9195_003995 [Heterodermia aff. obscurata]
MGQKPTDSEGIPLELLLARHADEITHQLVLGQQLRCRAVRNEASAGLVEDVIRHGVAQQAFEIDEVQSRALREVLEGGFLPDGEALCDFEARYGVQADGVFELGGFVQHDGTLLVLKQIYWYVGGGVLRTLEDISVEVGPAASLFSCLVSVSRAACAAATSAWLAGMAICVGPSVSNERLGRWFLV